MILVTNFKLAALLPLTLKATKLATARLVGSMIARMMKGADDAKFLTLQTLPLADLSVPKELDLEAPLLSIEPLARTVTITAPFLHHAAETTPHPLAPNLQHKMAHLLPIHANHGEVPMYARHEAREVRILLRDPPEATAVLMRLLQS